MITWDLIFLVLFFVPCWYRLVLSLIKKQETKQNKPLQNIPVLLKENEKDYVIQFLSFCLQIVNSFASSLV